MEKGAAGFGPFAAFNQIFDLSLPFYVGVTGCFAQISGLEEWGVHVETGFLRGSRR